jgi:ribonuclease P/MRP protein subunit RPP40
MNETVLSITEEEKTFNAVPKSSHKRKSSAKPNPFMKLYKQYVRPHLEFASPAWSPWQQGDKDVLEKVQEKAVKMVSGLKATEYPLRWAELNLETQEKRREDQDMSLVHKLASESIFSDT